MSAAVCASAGRKLFVEPHFFNWQKFGLALIWLLLLWVLALSMIRCFYQLDPPAAWLQIPYLLWLTFAAYLNFGVWMLNR